MIAGSTVYGGVRPNYYPWNTFLFWYALCFFIIFFPFLVCNLYYAYHDISCVDFRPPPFANGIKMSLAQWFQVDAYIMLGFIVFFFLIGIVAWCSPELACSYGLWEGLHVFYIIWRMAWLIVGSVLFWKGLRGLCFNNVRRYTYAMLIIGYVWLFVELFLAFGYPRPVPYPVAVPVGTGLRSSAVLAPVGLTGTPVYRPGGIVYWSTTSSYHFVQQLSPIFKFLRVSQDRFLN